jgi:hypothetical protein
MSTKRPSVTTLSDLIQKYTGSDYDKIVEIYENLDEIVRNSGLTLGVDYSENGFTQDNLDDLLRELTATTRQNQTAVAGIADINEAIALNLQSLNSILATNADIDLDVRNAVWAIDEDLMESNLDTKVPTQQSVRRYVRETITRGQRFQGGYDADLNVPQLDDRADPGNPAVIDPGIRKSDGWTVDTTGTFFGNPIAVGDKLQAVIDDPISFTDWIVIPNALDAASIATLYEGFEDVRRFTDALFIKLTAMEDFAKDDQLAVEVPLDAPLDGAVTEVTINNAGEGHLPLDILTATSGTGTGLTIVVDEVSLGVGAITEFTVTSGGSGYSAGETGITFSSDGTPTIDATFDITEVFEGNYPSFDPVNVQDAVYKLFTLSNRIEIDPLDGEAYFQDTFRDKTLSTATNPHVFKKDGLADNMYLSADGTFSTSVGFIIPYDATLVGVHAQGLADEGNLGDQHPFEIRVNQTLLGAYALSDGIFTDLELDNDLSAEDNVQVFITNTSDIDAVRNAIVTLYIKRRKI